ncbi:hypothetical protein JX265_012931 [Neoarthrinium moseri]|uniref:C2H2-type domain-containing protein n=1 Tax=Neoarthrinium moseri TaxID=1658444 RepID=A0A9P9W9T5_9PEZI|nr:hypothetical protein JX265_012931 [Neoarthrinium moseri]
MLSPIEAKYHEDALDLASESTYSTGPESPQADDQDEAAGDVDEETTEHGRTNATFAFVDPDEKNKWKRGSHKTGNFICPECGKGLSRVDALSRHRRTRHRVGMQYFCRQSSCQRALWGFGRFDNYRRHMETAHNIMIGPNDMQERHVAQRDLSKVPRPPRKRKGVPRFPPEPDHLYAQSAELSRSHEDYLPPAPPTVAPAPAAVLSTPGPVDAIFDTLSREELVWKLRAKIKECDGLQEQTRILRMERDEYIEALKISEELRGARSM